MSSPKVGRSPQYESALERDLLLLLDFDHGVDFFCEQPVTIEYMHEGVVRHYTPDVLVYYREDLAVSSAIRPTLYEVKYRDELRQNWAALKPRFMAALRYADRQGWRFKLITEREIRTEYLANVRFLRQYTGPEVQIRQTDQGLLMRLMQDIQLTTAEELLLMATADRTKRAELLYTLWHLVAVRLIHCDLTVELSLQTELWMS
ncbi:TnsA endonuclease N-terminal domain-containing protein [Hymenobacter yonginensis]|uniref:TnsA endonuclease N-terminal domain-containing protein n=1 Tax=Hymenobacter yonginensis TaxID=748197 RepID=A0ABY7PKS2_9BACT|nr:TnsA endonuclease N-terminal domain-containing protein [Hymenobacter yonginensis]WBO83622.1 TnsA endonuclease N-terminal domain-containing protein [Hymenobacter yonginensis]